MSYNSALATYDDYVEAVLASTIPACKFIRQACERSIQDMHRAAIGDVAFPYYFDPKATDRVIEFIQLLHPSKGEWAGRPLVLLIVNRIHILQKRAQCARVRTSAQPKSETNPRRSLLEVGELRDLQPVEHDLPAHAPRTQRRRFPVIFFELDVVLAQINPNRTQRLQIQLLHVLRWRFQNHLQLHVLEQPVGILPIAPVRWTPRRLHIRNFIGLRPQHAQKRLRRHGSRSNLNVVGLLQYTSTLRPKGLKAQDKFLKCQRIGRGRIHRFGSWLLWLLALGQYPRM